MTLLLLLCTSCRHFSVAEGACGECSSRKWVKVPPPQNCLHGTYPLEV